MNSAGDLASLKLTNVTKRFGKLIAIDHVSVEFLPGEVHAVVGENGAGKSTLMNLIAGFLTPDEGEINLGGIKLPEGKPFEAKKLGIGMVHQHFTLVPQFTVGENLALARLSKLAKPLNVQEAIAPILVNAEELGWQIDPAAIVKPLPVGIQQRIEILKSLSENGKIVILDEPTAPLSKEEVSDLLRAIKSVANSGKIVILIAHKLLEVLSVADRITVLRGGKLIATEANANVDEQTLAKMMLGHEPSAEFDQKPSLASEGLEVRDLSVLGDRGNMAVSDVSFQIQKFEILGIGGVDGNGQIELSETLAGLRKAIRGKIEFEKLKSPVIGFIPGDRQSEGLSLGLSTIENLLLGNLDRPSFYVGPFFRIKRISKWAKYLIHRYNIRVGNPHDPIDSLSGGNQQKVVVARELDRNPDLIISVNPTRGLDFNATNFVYEKLREARNRGAAIVIFSADLNELDELADRSLFMNRGKIVSEAGLLK